MLNELQNRYAYPTSVETIKTSAFNNNFDLQIKIHVFSWRKSAQCSCLPIIIINNSKCLSYFKPSSCSSSSSLLVLGEQAPWATRRFRNKRSLSAGPRPSRTLVNFLLTIYSSRLSAYFREGSRKCPLICVNYSFTPFSLIFSFSAGLPVYSISSSIAQGLV